ncbi:MAG: hypothetical protein HQL97_02075 [Magnetococcales bacterium]|nr:hypothetical protein [Magnetococcales bacterium]
MPWYVSRWAIAHPEPPIHDGIILAVTHRQFKEMGSTTIRGFGKPGQVIDDLKYLFGAEEKRSAPAETVRIPCSRVPPDLPAGFRLFTR